MTSARGLISFLKNLRERLFVSINKYTSPTSNSKLATLLYLEEKKKFIYSIFFINY